MIIGSVYTFLNDEFWVTGYNYNHVAITAAFGELNLISFFCVKIDWGIENYDSYILRLWEIKRLLNMLTVDFFEKQFTDRIEIPAVTCTSSCGKCFALLSILFQKLFFKLATE